MASAATLDSVAKSKKKTRKKKYVSIELDAEAPTTPTADDPEQGPSLARQALQFATLPICVLILFAATHVSKIVVETAAHVSKPRDVQPSADLAADVEGAMRMVIQQPAWVRPWTKHAGKNCYAGHGSTDLPSAAGKVGLAACEAACLALPGCEGIVLPTAASGKDSSGISCYRRKQVDLSKCAASTAYETHLLAPLPPLPPSAPEPPAPPPQPAAPPSAPEDFLELINARWLAGKPSSDATIAGVFVTLLDSMHSPRTPWLPCSPGDWCYSGTHHTTFSGSVINRRIPGLYRSDLMGFVIHPDAVSLRCAYSTDGSTQGPHDPCPPGHNRWCTHGAEGTWRDCCRYGDGQCAWRASQLDQAMTSHERLHPAEYNELVFEYAPWVAHLPSSVLAVFVPARGDVGKARALHRNLLAWRRQQQHTPLLLRYDPGQYPDAPFRALL